MIASDLQKQFINTSIQGINQKLKAIQVRYNLVIRLKAISFQFRVVLRTSSVGAISMMTNLLGKMYDCQRSSKNSL